MLGVGECGTRPLRHQIEPMHATLRLSPPLLGVVFESGMLPVTRPPGIGTAGAPA
ncbi:hypothetical protein GCM10009850_097330 [Nonomuraea monospora]|uniref:Uncharacterized protein n=1 Tax=Nonomuraea monospora TaxID=568818 RepID=A0ABN3CXU6_9ACTN